MASSNRLAIGSILLLALLAAASRIGAADAQQEFHKWAPTPPMGWNSYDNFGDTVTEAEVMANAEYQRKFLLPHGWQYVVVDYRWYDSGARDNNPNARAGVKLDMDEFGRLLPATNRFPSAANGQGFKPLAEKVHDMGLKFGIHIMRGIPRQAVQANLPIEGSAFKAADAANVKSMCGWSPDMYGVDATKAAGQAWYDSIFRLYAAWEVDFVKVDDLSCPYSAAEIEAVRRAIDKTGRRIVFSTSPGGTPVDQVRHVSANANMWRVSGDFWDNWADLSRAFDLAAAWTGVARPGCWPDHDMLPLGHIGLRAVGGARTTHFTRDEQLTIMSFWCMASSPLMVGANLPQNDDWTLSLLTNDEAIAINQDPLGKSAVRVSKNLGIEVWVKELANGDRALGVFNRGGRAFIGGAREVFRSDRMTKETPGLRTPVVADIKGARKLLLVVDDGGDGYQYDHADWLEPKLIGPKGELSLTKLKWNYADSGWQSVAVGKSVSGGSLEVNGKTYTDGIGTSSPSLIEYDLPDDVTRFTAIAGLDKGGIKEPHGPSVHFLVYVVGACPSTVQIPLRDLGIAGKCGVRNIWNKADLPPGDGAISVPTPPPHGCALYRLKGDILDSLSDHIVNIAKFPIPSHHVQGRGQNFRDQKEWPLPALKIAANAPVPPMGYSLWNVFGDNPGPSDGLTRELADALVSTGLKDCGYTYLLAFDGAWWSAAVEPGRDAHGRIIVDKARWPNGIQSVCDYIHGKGLKVAGYTDTGELGYCAPAQRGAWGHEQQDADQYASWGWDYIKIDDHGPGNYFNICRAVANNAAKRPVVISLSTPATFAGDFGPRISNMWRVNGDITLKLGYGKWEGDNSILYEFDAAEKLWWMQAPGHWNDLDMLLVGLYGITDEEAKSHLGMWAIRGAPLIIGCDIRPPYSTSGPIPKINRAQLALLKNREVIGVDQDALGACGRRVAREGAGEVYVKPLGNFTGGKVAVLLLNRSDKPIDIGVKWTDLGLVPGKAFVRDLWAHADLGEIMDGWTAKNVPAHGTAMLLVNGLYDWSRPREYEAEWSYNSFGGVAHVRCKMEGFSSTAGVVGVGCGAENTLKFHRIAAPQAGSYSVEIFYACSVNRTAEMSINGGEPVCVDFPSTGSDDKVGKVTLMVLLAAGESNTVKFANARDLAPAFDRITVNR